MMPQAEGNLKNLLIVLLLRWIRIEEFRWAKVDF